MHTVHRLLAVAALAVILAACGGAIPPAASSQPTAGAAAPTNLPTEAPTPVPTAVPTPTPVPGDPIEITFEADKDEYKVGDTVRFTTVYTNNTTLSMDMTFMVLGGGVASFSSGGTLAPGESDSPDVTAGFQAQGGLKIAKTGQFTMELTVTGRPTSGATKEISSTATLTITVK